MTWVRKFSQSANDVLWLNGTTAIATLGVSIYRSTNAGDTWSEISSQISTGFIKMTLLPNGTIVGVSAAGDAWRSTDGGLNWTQTLVGLGALPASWNVSFSNDQIGAIVGQSGFIFKTTDGGLTWAMLNSGIGVEFRDLEMLTTARAWQSATTDIFCELRTAAIIGRRADCKLRVSLLVVTSICKRSALLTRISPSPPVSTALFTKHPTAA